ncbi:hypothetical protein M2139_001893 [Enterococcus sp. PF1-24]|uniref:1-acyl-sn-glycerol-3-phosphate acyltransferase n=1 Tax=unclassified Enterococcus TaxID=2608891 RepID=UPI002475A44D|nr:MULTISPECIES: 1-acyl-sn-glycerol-3-phosphate acyltransferase [unclassified Enterococcus]MDH6364892.1 hypothetical protein [Enterococcus sp. PFB1-1]MDH6401993.1 hypothetical protein [Enterococcus sp. PF1-24]
MKLFRKKRQPDLTPFDRKRKPPKQNLFFLPLIWLFCWVTGKSNHLKIQKHNMQGLKPPYLVLGSHHAFMDFYITPLALFPQRANYISELDGFEYYGEWLYRQAGCLGTRKFVNDFALIKNIQQSIKEGRIVVIYPEARYANVGTHSQLPTSVGKMVKMLKVPVVTLNMHGNYLQSPIWNLKKRKNIPLTTEMTQLFTAEEVADLPVETLQAKIQAALSYDEYAWQKEQQIEISETWRAEGLHHALYQCCACGSEYQMTSAGSKLRCQNCESQWELSPLGELILETTNKSSTDFAISKIHIPDWYEWQRQQVIQEIQRGNYHLDIPVKIEALPNAVNFIDLGTGRLQQQVQGCDLTFTDYGSQVETTLNFPSASMYSIHTEYNYRDKGPCVVLSTLDNSYFIFPQTTQANVTKIQFAVEYLTENH